MVMHPLPPPPPRQQSRRPPPDPESSSQSPKVGNGRYDISMVNLILITFEALRNVVCGMINSYLL